MSKEEIFEILNSRFMSKERYDEAMIEFEKIKHLYPVIRLGEYGMFGFYQSSKRLKTPLRKEEVYIEREEDSEVNTPPKEQFMLYTYEDGSTLKVLHDPRIDYNFNLD